MRLCVYSRAPTGRLHSQPHDIVQKVFPLTDTPDGPFPVAHSIRYQNCFCLRQPDRRIEGTMPSKPEHCRPGRAMKVDRLRLHMLQSMPEAVQSALTGSPERVGAWLSTRR